MGHRLAQYFEIKCGFTKECMPPISVLAGIPAFLHGIQYNPWLGRMLSKHPVAGKVCFCCLSGNLRKDIQNCTFHIFASMRNFLFATGPKDILFV